MWANKKFLVNVTEAEDDGTLFLIDGDIPILKGNMIAVNQLGETFITTKSYFEINYIQVEKVKEKVDIDQMAENYRQNWEMFEEDDYIERFQETVRQRNNLDNN